MKPLNLGSFVDWSKLIAQLTGGEPLTRALPARIQCPICRAGRMSIFQHFVAGGQWHYCDHCGQKGDTIQLAAKVWGVSVPGAIAKCVSLGFGIQDASSKAVAEYVEHYHQAPQRADRLWNESQEGWLYASGRRLAQQMVWRVNPSVGWNQVGVSQILGCLDSRKVQSILAGDNISNKGPWPVDGFTANTKSGRLFRSKEWGDVLMVPYYDLPGRIAAFQFIGLDGSSKGQIFACTDSDSLLSRREAGIAYHPTLRNWSEPVLAFRDLGWYMRLQTRQLEAKAEPAPFVCWRSGIRAETQTAWQGLETRQVVFWDQTIDVSLLRQVLRVDGRIWYSELKTRDAIIQFLANTRPWELCERFVENSRPWAVALANYFAGRPDQELEDLMLQLEAAGEDVAGIRSHLPKTLAKRARRLTSQAKISRSIVVDSRTIEERPDGWYVKKGDRDEQILNVIPRFDSLVWYPRSGQAQYQGRLIHARKEIPFYVSRETAESDTIRWLQSEMLRAQAGVLQYSPSWSKKLMAIAARFHEPKMVTGLDTVGWDEKMAAFVLPTYSIQFGGKIVEHDHFKVEPYNTPGDLPKPGSVNPSTIMKAVESTEGSRAFWSIFVAIAANIVAPAVNRSKQGIALLGYSSQQIAAAAAVACDCRTYKAEDVKVDWSGVSHQWPRYIMPGSDFSPKWRRIYVESFHGSSDMIEVDLPQAASLLFLGRWHVLEAAPEASFDIMLSRELSDVLPSYLQYLAETRFEEIRTDGPLIAVVRKSLAGWIQNTFGCQPHGVYGLDGRWRNIWESGQTDHAQMLARLLYMLLSDGHVMLVPFKNDQPKAIWQGKKGIYLPKVLLRDCLLKCDGVQLEPDNVTKQLTAAGCLLGEMVAHGRSCWLIDEKWLSQQLHQVRNRKLKLIRLAEGT